MDRFVPQQDQLGNLINERAGELYQRLRTLDVDKLDIPYHCLHYLKGSHTTRLFFSIETSAHILYRSLTLAGKFPSTTTFMDYGAGVGTLFLLAKLIECKEVIYNDHLEDWRKSAQIIAEVLGIRIDHYVVGDIDDCLSYLDQHSIRCDIIASRNVVEHIYKLDRFFDSIHSRQGGAIVYSSTTANILNPASVMKHRVLHRKWEKVYLDSRSRIINQMAPKIDNADKARLAASTRGLGAADLKKAIENFISKGELPNPIRHRSNTCEPVSGVWAEHLLTHAEYRSFIGENKYRVRFEPGFWDTHYDKGWQNAAAKTFNTAIRKNRKIGLRLAPFIYVIAIPGGKNQI